MRTEHRIFIDRAKDICEADLRIDALLAAGSIAHGATDRFSDIDLVVVCRAEDYVGIMASRAAFAAKLGELLASFTGEHVGEPRLLICLYGDPLLHVDLKFVTKADLVRSVEKPLVVFDRDGSANGIVEGGVYEWPSRDPDWFETRFWIWMHYCAGKIARGELFEAVGMLAFAREQILGPLVARRKGLRQRGVRRVETESPEWIEKLAGTIPAYDRRAAVRAMLATIAIYRDLRSDNPPKTACTGAEESVTRLIHEECGKSL